MISQTEENYLKCLFALTNLNGAATINELSKHLDVKMPTANSMMKRLAEKELIIYESYKPIKLSAKGKTAAALIIRKHRLTEMYLVEKMGFGWEEVHDIAEQIEHIQSPVFFEKMDELLGYPTVDPHGSPIPDIHGHIVSADYMKLSDCQQGTLVTFKAVAHSSEELLKFLNGKDLTLGTAIFITAVEPFDGSMEVQYKEREIEVLSLKVCEKLLVSKEA